MLSLIYSQKNRDLTKAKQYLQSCLQRDPRSVPVLNNLAVVEVKRGEMGEALSHWRQAVEVAPQQVVVQNLGRVVQLTASKQLNLNKSTLANFSELYASQLGNKFSPMSDALGWLYLLIDEESLDLALSDDEKPKPAGTIPPPDEAGLQVVGSGTGFVVAPGYVLTNAHVVKPGTAIELQTSDAPKGKTLRTTLVAKTEKPDLALLKCEELDAPPLPIDMATSGRGTDIMIFGYPHTALLGSSLKATRGVISALPHAAVDDMYLYDAVVNPGNSGGPVCDSRANVVAVETIGISTEGKYGGGIPGIAVMAFLKKNLPDFRPTALNARQIDWTAVDQKVSPSTVLIWVRKKVGAGEAVARVGTNYVEDITCTPCSRGKAPNPKCPVCQGSGIDAELVDRKATALVAAGKLNPPAAPPGPATRAPGVTPPGVRDRDIDIGKTQNDANKSFIHPPLDGETATLIRNVIVKGQLVETNQVGTSRTDGAPFHEFQNIGGLLIGLDLVSDVYLSRQRIVALRGIYLTTRGKTTGAWHGIQTNGGASYHIEARPGYAVAGLKVEEGTAIDTIIVVFMRVNQAKFDPSDRYSSPAIGAQGTVRDVVGMTGSLVVGIAGREPSDPTRPKYSMGLIMMPRDN
jgi:S1-C subfamily serine protease